MQGKFTMVAIPATWKAASCSSESLIKIVGGIDRGLGVELNVPLWVSLPPKNTPEGKAEKVLRSMVERDRGNAARAIDLLASVAQYEQNCWQVPFHRAQAYLAAGTHAKAASEFETLLGHRGWDGWEIVAPLAQLGLARTYAMQGDRAESRKAYEEFFTTWKDADADIPILRQAKDEYKKITASASGTGMPQVITAN